MDLFKIDPGLAIWTWVSFGILFFILSKFVFPALFKSIKAREELIASSVDKALELEQKLAELDSQRAEILKKAREEADTLLRQTRNQAEALGTSLKEQAEAEARDIRDQAKLQGETDRKAALAALQSELADFVCASAEQVVQTSFTKEQDRAWAQLQAGRL